MKRATEDTAPALRKTSRFATSKVQPAPGFRRFAEPLRRPEKKRTRLFFQIGATCGKDGARAAKTTQARRRESTRLRLRAATAIAFCGREAKRVLQQRPDASRETPP